MASSIATKVNDTIQYLKAELQAAIDQQKGFVRDLEKAYFIPQGDPWNEYSPALHELGATVEVACDNLKKYGIFDPSLIEFADQAEDSVGDAADQFMAWAFRRGVTVKEAAEIYSRSKSTIYRWIKSGKLDAVKVGRRWVIAV